MLKFWEYIFSCDCIVFFYSIRTWTALKMPLYTGFYLLRGCGCGIKLKKKDKLLIVLI